MQRLGVLVPAGAGALVPSLAGLLTLGTYPQQFFPQWNVTFVVFPPRGRESFRRAALASSTTGR